MSKKYKIFFIGKFAKIYDEEYIAQSFEFLGHEVVRCEQSVTPDDIGRAIDKSKPDIILYMKWDRPESLDSLFARLSREGVRTVCWLFDLYWDYNREHQIHTRNFFKSDYVFTTDGGHEDRWKEAGVNHQCVRQGIFRPECYMLPKENFEFDLVFVGSENPLFVGRTELVEKMLKAFPRSKWFGRKDTDEMRSTELNKLYSKTKVVIGDSYPSPRYWSNRVVETLGRGGFLIHQDIEGLKEEYPHLVTYNGTEIDLKNKIKFYIEHPKEREEIVWDNFAWVKNNYTMDKKCAELLSKL